MRTPTKTGQSLDAASRLQGNLEQLKQEYIRRLRNEIPPLQDQSDSTLVDSLPDLIRALIDCFHSKGRVKPAAGTCGARTTPNIRTLSQHAAPESIERFHFRRPFR